MPNDGSKLDLLLVSDETPYSLGASDHLFQFRVYDLFMTDVSRKTFSRPFYLHPTNEVVVHVFPVISWLISAKRQLKKEKVSNFHTALLNVRLFHSLATRSQFRTHWGSTESVHVYVYTLKRIYDTKCKYDVPPAIISSWWFDRRWCSVFVFSILPNGKGNRVAKARDKFRPNSNFCGNLWAQSELCWLEYM